MTDATEILNYAMDGNSTKLSTAVDDFIKNKVSDIFVSKRDELEQEMLGSDDDSADDDLVVNN
ncbi:MAG: hypothetical protein L3J58_12455 [Emcibacter sp.]|nr:hypothetical protein [Emcibacter sp.]